MKSREERITFVENRIQSDVNDRLIVYTRNRIYKCLKSIAKQSSSRNILGIGIETYYKWIEFQLTPAMTWDNIEIDHVKPIFFMYLKMKN